MHQIPLPRSATASTRSRTLSSGPAARVRVDHLVGHVARHGREVAAAKRLADRGRGIAEPVHLPQRRVGAHRGVEADRLARRVNRRRLVVVDRTADGGQEVESGALAPGAAQSELEVGDQHLVEPAHRAHRVADHPVGDVARRPRHSLLHGRGVDRDRLANLGMRAHPALDVDVVVGALVADRLGGARLLDDQPHRLDRLAQMRGRAPVLGPVPGLVEALDPGSEAEAEATSRGLVDVERREGDDHRAAGESPRDPGADSDPLGRCGEPHRLGQRAAEELHRPDAVDPGGLRGPGLLGEVLDGVAEAR